MKADIPVYDICSLTDFKHNEILVSRFAPYLKSHENLRQLHRHSFYHVVLFTEGSGHHSIDFQQFRVSPYQIYFMIPGQVHSWEFDGAVDGYIINFSESFFHSFLLKPLYLEEFYFFNGITEDAVVEIPSFIHDKVIALFEEILQEVSSKSFSHLEKVKVIMLHLFMHINDINSGDKPKTAPSYNQTLLKNFRKLIEKNYTNLKLPKDYAELLYITPNHLNALCNDMLGISAGEVIRNRVILEAKRLLVNLDLSITTIAYSLNFTDNSYFTKFFKKQVGLTPDEFRKKIINHSI